MKHKKIVLVLIISVASAVFAFADFAISFGPAYTNYFVHTKNEGNFSTFSNDVQNALKNELTKNHPVLVVIGQGFAWQHYILLTGYDKEFIYTVDSLCGENPGTVMNKSYETEEFFRLWKNSLPVYNCLFFQLDEKNTPKNQMP